VTAEPTKGERTRQKLVDATAALLRRQGYHATGLAEIVAESGAPRGSLYFHFPGGKDELAIAALRASGDQWRARIHAAIAGITELGDSIDAIVAVLADELEASGWDHGCPVAPVALEATSEPVRATIVDHFASWLALSEAHLAGFGVPRDRARSLAVVAVSSVEGALMLARVLRSREPLVAVGRALRALAALAVPASPTRGARPGRSPRAARPTLVARDAARRARGR
jgi:TetR/AcrR family transcriptional regulator, lmrAB and yxaGH operons repressor